MLRVVSSAQDGFRAVESEPGALGGDAEVESSAALPGSLYSDFHAAPGLDVASAPHLSLGKPLGRRLVRPGQARRPACAAFPGPGCRGCVMWELRAGTLALRWSSCVTMCLCALHFCSLQNSKSGSCLTDLLDLANWFMERTQDRVLPSPQQSYRCQPLATTLCSKRFIFPG